jgi:Uncharacterized protein conserved in bacteria (DUF2330)
MARRLMAVLAVTVGVVVAAPAAAFACGGLIAPGHGEVLQKATTLVAWHGGYEHYVTGFQFAGAANRFGYIIPLPGNPTRIQKGGEWTLERLEREVNPVPEAFRLAAADAAGAPAPSVAVLQRVRVDALDITIVRGGGRDVAAWAAKNGFDLTPDTPDVLGAYSSSGAIFALAKFDGLAAEGRGLVEGQGTVIHFTIPTQAPWVPLRILALGKAPNEPVLADLFMLTDHRPSLSRVFTGAPGVERQYSDPATPELLADLGSDRGMSWVPKSGMWLTAYKIDTVAAVMGYDLSIDGGSPSGRIVADPSLPLVWPWVLAAALGAVAAFVLVLATPSKGMPGRPA